MSPRQKVFRMRYVIRSAALGFFTTLVVAALLGWYDQYGLMNREYKASVPERPQWRIVRRYESFGESHYLAYAWWQEVPFQGSSPYSVRTTFRRASWEEATLKSLAWGAGGPDGSALMIEWGWPFRCFWGAGEWKRSFPRAGSELGLYYYFRQIDPSTTLGRTIPYAPISAGLAIDTLFWGAPWWLTLFGIRRIGRWNRRRRNCCPSCNYNLSGLPPSSPCPECGRAAFPATQYDELIGKHPREA